MSSAIIVVLIDPDGELKWLRIGIAIANLKLQNDAAAVLKAERDKAIVEIFAQMNIFGISVEDLD